MSDTTIVEVGGGDSTAVRVAPGHDTTTVEIDPAKTTVVQISPLQEATVVALGPAKTTVVGSGEIGPAGPPGAPGPGTEVDVVAAIDLSGQRVVVPDGSGGVVYADPFDPTHLTRAMWLTIGAVSAGATGSALALGELEEPSWSWTPGTALYLGPGGMLVTIPALDAAFVRIMASAVTPTRIFFAPEVPIRLS